MAGAQVGARVQAYRPDDVAVGCFVVDAPGQYGLLRLYQSDPNAPELPTLAPGDCVQFRLQDEPMLANGEETWCPPAESYQATEVALSLPPEVGDERIYLPVISR